MLQLILSTQNRPELSVVHDKSVNVFRNKLCQQKNHPFKDVNGDEILPVMADILEMAKSTGSWLHHNFAFFKQHDAEGRAVNYVTS